MIRKSIFFVFLLLICSKVNLAQKKINIKDSIISIPIFGVSYAPQLPGGDLKERFGFNHNIGANFFYKTNSNWIWNVNWNFLFGKDVKEDNILSNITTTDNLLINQNGEPADIRFYERGQFYGASIGKIIIKTGPNPNSGIFVTTGLGFLMHKIRIEDIGNSTAQLNGDYKKGYDRLTYGLALNQSLGYLFLANNKLLNFYACADFTQGFTKNKRGYNFDKQQYDSSRKLDLLYGFRVGFLIPIYKRIPDEFYYN